jgi:hypothetical protein
MEGSNLSFLHVEILQKNEIGRTCFQCLKCPHDGTFLPSLEVVKIDAKYLANKEKLIVLSAKVKLAVAMERTQIMNQAHTSCFIQRFARRH